MRRLVAVLGYSDGRAAGLHPICASRLQRAALEAGPDDMVLFSGWARRGSTESEADLMAAAWRRPTTARLVDRGARTTLGNVLGVARAARALGVDEIVVVTSRWHGRRAALLLRAALAGTHSTVRLVTTPDSMTARRGARELAAWAVLPILAAVASRTR